MQARQKVFETRGSPDVANSIQNVFSSSNFLDNISMGMLLRNAEGVVINCNSAAEAILETPRDALIGKVSTGIEGDSLSLDGTPFAFQCPLSLDSLRSMENRSGII